MECLRLSPPAWEAALGILASYAPSRVESGCLLYGTRDKDVGHAVLVGVPGQINRRFNFQIPADDLERLNRAVPEDFVVVAQMHTHPGDSVAQSPWDDELVVSRSIFSLVVPNYGAHPTRLDQLGAHTFHQGQWSRLTSDTMPQRLWLDNELQPHDPIIIDTR